MLEMGLYAAIAPLVLLILGSIWRYPAVLEEVVKCGVMRMGRFERENFAEVGIVVGLTFGLSETVLYTMNTWASMDWRVIVWRLLLTVPMHVVTAISTAWGIKYKRIYEGLGCALVIHAIFNYLVA